MYINTVDFKRYFLEKYQHEQVLIFSISKRFILIVMMNKDYSLAHLNMLQSIIPVHPIQSLKIVCLHSS